MSFIGFVIFIIFALAFRDIFEEIEKYIDRGEAASTSAQCQAEFLMAPYTLDVLGEFDSYVWADITLTDNLGSAGCPLKGSGASVTLDRTDRAGTITSHATTLTTSSSGQTSWFNCPQGIQTQGAKMKEIMYKLISKM